MSDCFQCYLLDDIAWTTKNLRIFSNVREYFHDSIDLIGGYIGKYGSSHVMKSQVSSHLDGVSWSIWLD